MADTKLYWQLRGTFNEKVEKLSKADRKWLEACIIDEQYNEFLSSRSDYNTGDVDKHGHGKRLPYIGWFWRHLKFSDGDLPIGNCGVFIGFIANNKWEYDQRATTREEFNKIMDIIDRAMVADQDGGTDSTKTYAVLDELWDYLQTLTI